MKLIELKPGINPSKIHRNVETNRKPGINPSKIHRNVETNRKQIMMNKVHHIFFIIKLWLFYGKSSQK